MSPERQVPGWRSRWYWTLPVTLWGLASLPLTAFAILAGPGTTEAAFGPGPIQGKVFVMPASGILLVASNLPPAPAGKTYAMWILAKSGGRAVGAGLFQPETSGAVLHVRRGAVDPAAAGAVAITLETEGGSDQPTSSPIAVAALGW